LYAVDKYIIPNQRNEMGRLAACMRPIRNVYSFSEEAMREEPIQDM